MKSTPRSAPHSLRPHAAHRFLFCLLIAAAAMAHPRAEAATITVRNKNDAGPGSLRHAIAHASDNDMIVFAENVRGTIAILSGQLSIGKPLAIAGPGADLLTLNVRRSRSAVFSIKAAGSVVISGLTLRRGGAYSEMYGGAIHNESNLTVDRCTIHECGSAQAGGGIYNNSGASLTLLGCTLSENGAVAGSLFGGGSREQNSSYGGALFNASGATAILRNCTFTVNYAQGSAGCGFLGCGEAGDGYGAIFNQGDMLVEGCTIAGNAARGDSGYGAGGGIASYGVTTRPLRTRLTNTILAANITDEIGPDGAGEFTSGGFNLLGIRSGTGRSFHAQGDLAGTTTQPLDPKVGPLQDNGGRTFTMALLPGSPATDQGSAGTLTTDQRGRLRPQDFGRIANPPGGDGSDIGAFEVSKRGLLNISTRATVRTGDEALMVGFIVTPGEPKEVIARGLGPSLPFEHALADPNIQLFDAQGALLA